MRRLIPALFALVPSLAAAQSGSMGNMGAMHDNMADPDKTVAGGLRVPGWSAHFDKPGTAPTAVKFYPSGKGVHVTAGPAAIYFDPKSGAAGGGSTIRATFTQMRAPTHPEAYGLVLGGEHLATDSASYLYYIVRGDGKYAIKHRADAATVHTVVDWTASPALHAADASGRATNALRVVAGADSTRFYANDRLVTALPASKTGSLAGTAGVRVNHNLDVQVDGFAVAPGARGTR